MFIKRVYSFDDNSGEADLIVSDGVYDLICFCPFYQNESTIPKVIEIETFLCEDIMRVDAEEYLIIKGKEYYSYHLKGEVLDTDKYIVSIGNLVIKLDKPIPKDIKRHEFIEFYALRLDCYIENN